MQRRSTQGRINIEAPHTNFRNTAIHRRQRQYAAKQLAFHLAGFQTFTGTEVRHQHEPCQTALACLDGQS
jgi:hypothetical protein